MTDPRTAGGASPQVLDYATRKRRTWARYWRRARRLGWLIILFAQWAIALQDMAGGIGQWDLVLLPIALVLFAVDGVLAGRYGARPRAAMLPMAAALSVWLAPLAMAGLLRGPAAWRSMVPMDPRGLLLLGGAVLFASTWCLGRAVGSCFACRHGEE